MIRRSAWASVFLVWGCARTVPTSPPPAPPPPPKIQIPAGCESKLTGEWQLEDDATFRYHFEDDGAEATVWVYRVFPPPDAGPASRLFPRLARGDGGTLPVVRDAGTLKDGGVDLINARYIAADEQFGKQNYEDAAKSYLQIVNEEPKRDFAATALDSAAQAYERTRRFADAVGAYDRLVREYPKSKLAEAALFRLAVNAEATSDFTRAIDSYQKLIKDYPLSRDRPAAMVSLGTLFAGTGRDTEALAAWARFVELYPKHEDAPKVQLKIADLYAAKKDFPREITALNALLQKFGGSKALTELIVQTRGRIAAAWLKLDKEAEVKKALAATADEYDRRVPAPDGTAGACETAAAARFALAEYDGRDYEKLKLSGAGKALDKSVAAKNAALKVAHASYDKVLKYKRPGWSGAALYRKGELLDRFAQQVQDTPAPPEVTKAGDAAVTAFSDQLLAQRVDLEDRATQAYRALLALGQNDEGTQKARAALDRLHPPAPAVDGGVLTPDAGVPDAGKVSVDAGVLDAGKVSETSSAGDAGDAGKVTVTSPAADSGSPRPDGGFDGGEEAEHHHPLPSDLMPRDGGTPPLATAVIHLRRTPGGFTGEAETLHLLPSGRECRATFPTRIAACGSSTLTLVSAASTPVGDGCQTPTVPRPAALLEHHLARSDAGEL